MPFIIGIKGVMLLANTVTTNETRYCAKCNRTMKVTEFYQSNNLDKYPDRYLN